MISDEDVKRLFYSGNQILRNRLEPTEILPNQFYRGMSPLSWEGQSPGMCKRHMAIFDRFDVIPKYCFSCYKVVIEPRTVIELFKLMVIFEKLKLPNDNTRKCLVECREQVAGTYKGLIYCRSTEEGKEIIQVIQKVLGEEISNKIPVKLKRGCSEHAVAHPEFAKTGQGAATIEYDEKWQEYEKLVDKDFINSQPAVRNTYNHPSFTLRDAKVMLAWLKYAATIGDLSYLKITGQKLAPWDNIKRPVPFQPIKNN